MRARSDGVCGAGEKSTMEACLKGSPAECATTMLQTAGQQHMTASEATLVGRLTLCNGPHA